MRIEEVFDQVNKVLKEYDSSLIDLNYLISESQKKDYLVTDITSRIAHLTGKNKRDIARYFVDRLPFRTIINTEGELEFYLWQEADPS